MNKKSVVLIVFTLVIAMLITACGSKPETKEPTADGGALKDGTYTSTFAGHNGDITLSATISDGKITEFNAVESSETKGLGEDAINLMTTAMVSGNTFSVDGVTSATVTSNAVKKIAENIAKEAGATDEDIKNMTVATIHTPLDSSNTYNYDVVVVGAGGAGLSAAITAKQGGANVAIIEKNGFVGGNTMVSGGGLNVAGSDLQQSKDIEDSVEKFTEDTLKGGDEKNNADLVAVMTSNSLGAYEWLKNDIGVKFIQDRVQQFGGHSVPRAAIPEGNHGFGLTTPLLKKALELGVEVFYDSKAVSLIEKDGAVTGVKVENNGNEIDFNASKGVVLATGGFGANVEMREKYNPDYGDKYKTTCLKSSLGEGIEMAEKVGAKLVDMEYIQVYPTCNPNTGIISYVANSRFDGAILVNQEGKRFINESDRRDVISQAILAQTDGIAYLVWGEEIESVGKMTEMHQVEFDQMANAKLISKTDSLKDGAAAFNIDEKTLTEEIAKFNTYVDGENDPEFNKTGSFRKIENGPFYIQKVTPATHHTMGGVAIDNNARVLNSQDQPIPGLFAAGEVVGGIHGTNRLGGNAITDIIVFGRIAGEQVLKDK